MSTMPSIRFTNSMLRMHSINYQVDDKDLQDELVTFNVNDSLKIVSQDKNKVHLICVRKINFTPESMFELTVEYEMIFTFLEELELKEGISVDSIVELINQTVLGSSLSHMISNITATEGRMPIITNPTFMAQE